MEAKPVELARTASHDNPAKIGPSLESILPVHASTENRSKKRKNSSERKSIDHQSSLHKDVVSRKRLKFGTSHGVSDPSDSVAGVLAHALTEAHELLNVKCFSEDDRNESVQEGASKSSKYDGNKETRSKRLERASRVTMETPVLPTSLNSSSKQKTPTKSTDVVLPDLSAHLRRLKKVIHDLQVLYPTQSTDTLELIQKLRRQKYTLTYDYLKRLNRHEKMNTFHSQPEPTVNIKVFMSQNSKLFACKSVADVLSSTICETTNRKSGQSEHETSDMNQSKAITTPGFTPIRRFKPVVKMKTKKQKRTRSFNLTPSGRGGKKLKFSSASK